jgi:hypothetical protein
MAKNLTLEQRTVGLLKAAKLRDDIYDDPNNYRNRNILGQNLKDDKLYFAGVPEDKVKSGADKLLMLVYAEFKKEVNYEKLIKEYDQQELVQILTIIPPLDGKDKKYSKVAKAHKQLYEITQAYKGRQKLAGEKPNEYIQTVIDSTKDEDDQYFAANDVALARKVDKEYVRAAQVDLLKAIYEIKPPKEKKK